MDNQFHLMPPLSPKCTLLALHAAPSMSHNEHADGDKGGSMVSGALGKISRLFPTCFSLCRFALFLPPPLFGAPSLGARGSCSSRLPLYPPLDGTDGRTYARPLYIVPTETRPNSNLYEYNVSQQKRLSHFYGTNCNLFNYNLRLFLT